MRLLAPGFSINNNDDRLMVLAEYCRLPLVSCSSLVAAAIRNRTHLGARAQACLEAGKLIPNALILQLLEERLTESDMQDGWVLSGFPRNMNQVAILNAMLLNIDQPYDVVIHLQDIDSRQTPTLIGNQLIYPAYVSADAVLKTPLGTFYNRLNQLVSISNNMSLATVYSLLRERCVGFAEN